MYGFMKVKAESTSRDQYRSNRGYMKIKMSKTQWEQMGKESGWMKSAEAEDILPSVNDDEEVPEAKRLSFTFGTTPEKVIKDRVLSQTPSGYPMHIKSQLEWDVIAKAINQGIDSHLEGFTRSTFDSRTGKCLIHPEEMTTFLRRLYESDDDEAWSLRGSILETLNVEEI